MLERIISRYMSSEKYADIFIISFLFTLIAAFMVQHVISFQVGGQNLAGLVVTLLLSIAVSYPFVRYMIEHEDREITADWHERRLLHRHASELLLYMSFFLGATAAFSIARFLFAGSFFGVQCSVLKLLGRPITNQCEVLISQAGLFNPPGATAAAAAAAPDLGAIFLNNLWVYISTFLLTFVFTSGIIFILAWNASVLGVWIGSVSHSALDSLIAVPFITALYLPHGILEVGAYILAGIGGALLSRQGEVYLFHPESSRMTGRVVKDVLILLVLGVLALVLGAIIEVA